MKLYSENESYKLYHGNMLDMLEAIEPNTMDSIVCDPPYELNFMAKGWDNSGIAFQPDTWKKCYEVLKPGGYLLAFGGSRTFHRIACAIEDAGFEIRDTIMWLYGSGFPKSENIGKMYDKKMGNVREKIGETKIGKTSLGDGSGWDTSQNMKDIKATGKVDITKGTSKWEGWGSCLKPSFEPIIVARKPFKGSLVDNVIEYGVGGINIDECRVEYEKTTNPATNPLYRQQNADKYKQVQGGELSNGAVSWTSGKNGVSEIGRFPANTILTYDESDFDEVCGGFPNTKSVKSARGGARNTGETVFGKYDTLENNYECGFNDSGSASRYFMNCKYTGKDEELRRYIYTPKASKKDRDEGLDEFEEKESKLLEGGKMEGTGFIGKRRNTHPTVKPTDLMQYLVRLVTPNNGTILDPFNGSGSTGKAVMYENKERNKNYKYIGIELTEEYLPIAKARIEYVCDLPKEDKQTTIFEFIETEE